MTDAQRAPDGAELAVLLRDPEGRPAGYDKQLLVARKLRDDVVRHAFGEIAAFLVRTDRGEGQDGNGRPIGQGRPFRIIYVDPRLRVPLWLGFNPPTACPQ
ncbi:MAG: hypothetical protein M3453_19505 [Pseudomonadota bacterium]|nr:hypothetical protein [Pseudomonadota bacterium]